MGPSNHSNSAVPKRMVSMDKQLVAALTALLIFYTIVTLRTLLSMPELYTPLP